MTPHWLYHSMAPLNIQWLLAVPSNHINGASATLAKSHHSFVAVVHHDPSSLTNQAEAEWNCALLAICEWFKGYGRAPRFSALLRDERPGAEPWYDAIDSVSGDRNSTRATVCSALLEASAGGEMARELASPRLPLPRRFLAPGRAASLLVSSVRPPNHSTTTPSHPPHHPPPSLPHASHPPHHLLCWVRGSG